MTDTTAATAPLVSIIMGSDSDWPTMRAAADILGELGIAFEADVVSAHRTPDKMVDFARAAAAGASVSSSPEPVERRTCRAWSRR